MSLGNIRRYNCWPKILIINKSSKINSPDCFLAIWALKQFGENLANTNLSKTELGSLFLSFLFVELWCNLGETNSFAGLEQNHTVMGEKDFCPKFWCGADIKFQA